MVEAFFDVLELFTTRSGFLVDASLIKHLVCPDLGFPSRFMQTCSMTRRLLFNEASFVPDRSAAINSEKGRNV